MSLRNFIILEFEIFRRLEIFLQYKLPEALISILVIFLRMIEVIIIIAGGILSIVAFVGFVFAFGWIVGNLF